MKGKKSKYILVAENNQHISQQQQQSIFPSTAFLKISGHIVQRQCERTNVLNIKYSSEHCTETFSEQICFAQKILESRGIYSTFLLRSNYKPQYIHSRTEHPTAFSFFFVPHGIKYT